MRGEKRIVWYLQLVQQVLERKGEGSNSGSDYIVKMFDDVDSSGKNKEKVKTAEGETSEDSEDEDEVPTVPNRLLVFESLVELDAPVMRKGSRVKTSSWSMEEVFMTSLEVIQGLKVSSTEPFLPSEELICLVLVDSIFSSLTMFLSTFHFTVLSSIKCRSRGLETFQPHERPQDWNRQVD